MSYQTVEEDDGTMSVEEGAYERQFPSEKEVKKEAKPRSRGQSVTGEGTKKTIATAIQKMAESPDAEPWHVALEKQMVADNPMFAAMIPGLITQSVLKHQRQMLKENKKQGVDGDKAYSNYLNSMMRHAQQKELQNLRNLPQLRRLANENARSVAKQLEGDDMTLSQIGDYLIQRNGRVRDGVSKLLNVKSMTSDGTFGKRTKALHMALSQVLGDEDGEVSVGLTALGLDDGSSKEDAVKAYEREIKKNIDAATAVEFPKTDGTKSPTANIVLGITQEALLETLHEAAAEDRNIRKYLMTKGRHPFKDTVSALIQTNWQIDKGNLSNRRQGLISNKKPFQKKRR